MQAQTASAPGERRHPVRHAEPGQVPRPRSRPVQGEGGEAPATHGSRPGRCRSTGPRLGQARRPMRPGRRAVPGIAPSGALRRSRVPRRRPTDAGSTASRPPGWCVLPPRERHRRHPASAGQTALRPTPRWSSTPQRQGAPDVRPRSTAGVGATPSHAALHRPIRGKVGRA